MDRTGSVQHCLFSRHKLCKSHPISRQSLIQNLDPQNLYSASAWLCWHMHAIHRDVLPWVKLCVGAWRETPGYDNTKQTVASIQQAAYTRYSSPSDAQLPNFLAQFLHWSWQYFLFVTSWWLDIYPEKEEPKQILSDSMYSYIFTSKVTYHTTKCHRSVTHLDFLLLS